MADVSRWRRMLGGGDDDVARALRELTSAVRELSDLQRKQAAQIKRLRESQSDMDMRWQAAVERSQKAAADAAIVEARAAAAAQGRTDERILRLQQVLEQSQKSEQKWRAVFRRQVDAVLRTLHVRDLPGQPPFDIIASRFRLRSQNEEDGMLVALFRRAGTTNTRFVDVGCGRSGGNAALFAYECGWSGLMLDISEPAIDAIRRQFLLNPGVVGVAAEVTPGNINDLLAEHGCAGEVDLFSLDIDSYDYWVLEAMRVCTPRIMVLEYNAAFGAERAVTIPRGQPLAGAPKGYHGASLAALEKLARQKGYRLVACENAGVNAFFLRNDVAPELKGITPAQGFRPALSRLDGDEVAIERGAFLSNPDCPLVEV